MRRVFTSTAVACTVLVSCHALGESPTPKLTAVKDRPAATAWTDAEQAFTKSEAGRALSAAIEGFFQSSPEERAKFEPAAALALHVRQRPALVRKMACDAYLYCAPRAPNDAWNGFYTDYNIPMFEQLIRQLQFVVPCLVPQPAAQTGRDRNMQVESCKGNVGFGVRGAEGVFVDRKARRRDCTVPRPRSTDGSSPSGPARSSTANAEEAASRDALRRFALFAKAKYLPVAPDPLLGDVLPKVEGCKLEFVDRAALVARHRGERKAPMIVAVTVQPKDPADAKAPITVLVALEVAAIEGFDEHPDALGREFVYRSTAAGAEFLKEQGWVE